MQYPSLCTPLLLSSWATHATLTQAKGRLQGFTGMRIEKGDAGIEVPSSLEPMASGASIQHPSVLGTCSLVLPG